MVRLPDGGKNDIVFTHFDVIHERDRHQSDGRTDTA